MAHLERFCLGILFVDFDLNAIYTPYAKADLSGDMISALDRLPPPRGKLWLVYRPEKDGGGKFLSAVRSRYRLIGEQSYPFAELLEFDTVSSLQGRAANSQGSNGHERRKASRVGLMALHPRVPGTALPPAAED